MSVPSGNLLALGNGTTNFDMFDGSGDLGIGTTTMASALAVNGGVAIGTYAATDTAAPGTG